MNLAVVDIPGGDGLGGGGDAVLVGAADGEEPLECQGQHQKDGRAVVSSVGWGW